MREIKFRGLPVNDIGFDEIRKTVSKDEFVEGHLIKDGDLCYILSGIAEVDEECFQPKQWIPVRPETVGQYICHNDVNDMEIFEGDIFIWNIDTDYDTAVIGVISYKEEISGFSLWLPQYEQWCDDDIADCCNMEIYANIHQYKKLWEAE